MAKLPNVNRGFYCVQVQMTRKEAERLSRVRAALGLRSWSAAFLHVLARHRVRPNGTEAMKREEAQS